MFVVEKASRKATSRDRFRPPQSKWWFQPVFNTNMDKVNTYAFYELGSALDALRQLKEGSDRSDLVLNAWMAEQAIEKFLLESHNVVLKLSKQSAEKLRDQCASIGTDSQDFEKPISRGDLVALNHALTEFDAIFSNETQGLDVFSIQQKQAYSMTTLIESGEEVLPESIRFWLDEFTINEIREATKCIAFDLPTAAGFHMLRGLESTLRDYYDFLSGNAERPRTKHGKDVPMGDYINEVEKLGAHEKVISVLRQIKTLHRDPHMHPEALYDMDGAIMLLGIVTSGIWVMFKEYTDDQSNLDDSEEPESGAAAASA